LARREGAAAINRLITRYTDITVDPTALRYHNGTLTHGLKSLPVRRWRRGEFGLVRTHREGNGHGKAGHTEASDVTGEAAATSRTELEMAEMRVIRAALKRHSGNKLSVARELGISRGTLYNRLRRYHL
jgi:DNA-binding NtrC family response regulator